MIKKIIIKCIQLTAEIMTSHYRNKHEMFRNHVHKDSLWIGSVVSEYYLGKPTILEEQYFYKNMEIMKGKRDEIVRQEKRIRKRE